MPKKKQGKAGWVKEFSLIAFATLDFYDSLMPLSDRQKIVEKLKKTVKFLLKKEREKMGKKTKLEEELYVIKYKYRVQKKGNMVSRKEVLKDLLKIGFYIGEYLKEKE